MVGDMSLAATSCRPVLRLLQEHERPRWQHAFAYQHYLGAPHLIGRSLCQVAHVAGSPDQWLGLIAWSEGALRYAARDLWLGWTALQRQRRRHLVLLNTRFLLLRTAPTQHLGSQVLAAATRRLADDWSHAHGVTPLLAETFVDPQRFTGSVYRAAGWMPIGLTTGFARTHGTKHFHGTRKLAFVQPLANDAREQLAAITVGGNTEPVVLLDPPALESLRGALDAIPDPRAAQGRDFATIQGLWTALVATKLAGWSPENGLESWLRTQPRARWREFGCRMSLQSPVPIVPSPATRRRALALFRNAGGVQVVTAWLAHAYPRSAFHLAA
jgi:hypothetical protein